LSLTGPDGLLKQLTKTVLETSLNEEMTEHLGHEKHGQPVTGNIGNGTRSKTVLTENTGEVEIQVPIYRRSQPHPAFIRLTAGVCIIHLIRNTFRLTSRRYWDEINRDVKPI